MDENKFPWFEIVLKLMKILLSTIPLFFNLSIRYSQDEKLLICTLRNEHKQEVYFKDIFDYYRFDHFNYIEESFVTLVVGTADKKVRLAGDYVANIEQYSKLKKGMPSMYYIIMLDKFSKIYYDKANPINHFSYGDLSFVKKKKITRMAVPIPLAPKDSFQFFIPIDQRLWKKSSFDFPENFKVGKDSLFLFLVADIPVSTKKTHASRFYKNQVITSDTIWFVPK